MTDEDAQRLLKKMHSLWPDWQINDDQVEAWLRVLLGHEYSDGYKAIQSHYEESRWKRPALPRVKFLMQAEVSRRVSPDESKKSSPVIESGVWAQCVSHPGGRLVGWYVPIVCSTRSPPAEHWLLDMAEKMRDRHAAHYGGEWIVVRGASVGQMLSRRQQLKRQHAREHPDV